MASLTRLKRRMVHEAVEENLDVIRGRLMRREGRSTRVLLTVARSVFLLGLPAALFASSYLLSNAAEGWNESRRQGGQSTAAAPTRPTAVATAVPAVAQASISLGAVTPSPESTTYLKPEPIDPAVLPLVVRRIVVDPGHGGDNHGSVAPLGLVEKEVTLDIARRLRRLLETAGYEVVMTRQSDLPLSLKERADLANESMGDIFLSIHVNWIANRGVRGVETYYLGPTDEPYLTALAAQENQDSGYSLAAFRSILERVYADVRQEESRQLAQAVQRALYASLHKVTDAVEDRGVKTAPFGVLTHTQMPAILAEVSTMSNESETRLLMQPSYRQFLAQALFAGIESYTRSLHQTELLAHQIGG